MRFIIEIFFQTFSIFLGEVSIGMNPHLKKRDCHGIAHIRGEDGSYTQKAFVVCDSSKLINPSMFAIRSMFHQIARMGMYPMTLELLVGGYVKVYSVDRYRPILVQKLQSTD